MYQGKGSSALSLSDYCHPQGRREGREGWKEGRREGVIARGSRDTAPTNDG